MTTSPQPSQLNDTMLSRLKEMRRSEEVEWVRGGKKREKFEPLKGEICEEGVAENLFFGRRMSGCGWPVFWFLLGSWPACSIGTRSQTTDLAWFAQF